MVVDNGSTDGSLDLLRAMHEAQRGLVHFHATIRLDHPDDRALSPGQSITAGELCDAIRQAGQRSRFYGHAGGGEVVELRFGDQLDTKVLHDAEDGEALDPEQVAAYVA